MASHVGAAGSPTAVESDGARENGDEGTILARAGWPELVEEIVRAACHDMNGVLSALDAAAHLVVREEPSLLSAESIQSEVGRARAAIEALEVVSGDDEGGPELLSPVQVARVATRTAEFHPALREVRIDVDVDGDPPAVRAPRSLVIRCLLLLLRSVGRQARSDSVEDVRIEVGERPGQPHVRLAITSPAEPSFTPEAPPADGALAALVRRLGGKMPAAEDRADGVAILLPTNAS